MRLPFWRRSEQQAQLEQEIQSHLQMAASDRAERGESPTQAQHAARREFGNVALVQHVTRDQWGSRWLDLFVCNLRYAVRTLGRTPSFSIAAILVILLRRLYGPRENPALSARRSPGYGL